MSHFLITNAPATDIIPATVPLIARLPNGNKVQSMHTCTLDLPGLSVGTRAAHIIPGLASTPFSPLSPCAMPDAQ